MLQTDEIIYSCCGFETPPRYSLFWHFQTGTVDCRIYSSENYAKIHKKWLSDSQYGLACNIR